MSESNGTSSLFDRAKAARRSERESLAPGVLAIDDREAYPLLTELLCALPSGALRDASLGSVRFFLNDGRLTCCVNLYAMKLHAFYSFEGFSDALTRLEGALSQGKLEWRQDKPYTPKKRS